MTDRDRAMDKDTAKARLLLEIRRCGVTDSRVLTAIESVPRELFVPAGLAAYAHEDSALPIACRQTISQPSLVALMTDALAVGERMKVLEIGTGSGYQSAILARLCRRVYTIECHRKLVKDAEKRFQALDIHNITTRVGDGTLGWPEQAPFPRIMVTAAAAAPPPALLDQLAPGGRMVIPLGPSPDEQILCRITREDSEFHRQDLIAVRFVPLIEDGAAPAAPR